MTHPLESLGRFYTKNGYPEIGQSLRDLAEVGRKNGMPKHFAERLEPIQIDLLTPRQIDVLRLAGCGLDNKSIGEKLHISKGAVEKHMRNVIVNLGVRRGAGVDARLPAVMKAIEEGYLDLDEIVGKIDIDPKVISRLSQSQLRTVALLADTSTGGMSRVEMAEKQGISIKTVAKNINWSLKKTGCPNTTVLAVMYKAAMEYPHFLHQTPETEIFPGSDKK